MLRSSQARRHARRTIQVITVTSANTSRPTHTNAINMTPPSAGLRPGCPQYARRCVDLQHILSKSRASAVQAGNPPAAHDAAPGECRLCPGLATAAADGGSGQDGGEVQGRCRPGGVTAPRGPPLSLGERACPLGQERKCLFVGCVDLRVLMNSGSTGGHG
jgi:hypothetical protein